LIKLYYLKIFIGSISSNCSDSSSRGEENEVGARKFSEAVVQTLSSVASVLEYPKSWLNYSHYYFFIIN